MDDSRTFYPLSLERCPPAHLRICWNDGLEQELALRALRDRCPCAACREAVIERKPANTLNILSPADVLPLEVVGMQPVGNYAYTIQFSDGHQTGIYTFELLRSLS